jgi:PAS domain S-box-containing protein
MIIISDKEGLFTALFMLRELRSGKIVQRVHAFGRPPPWAFSIGLTVAVAITYLLAARLSLALLTKPDGVAVFWPAAGIASGVLIRMGSVARIPVIVGTIAGTIAANLLGDRNVWSAIVFAVCNAGEAVLVAGLIARISISPFSLDLLHRVIGLFVAAIIATAISGIGGTVGFVLFHTSTASALSVWWHWFTSDAIGIITVAPLLIGLPSGTDPIPRKEFIEGASALAILTALSALVINLPRAPWADEIAVAAVFPLLLWIAARCRPFFAAAATFVCALTIVWTTTFGIGFFGDLALPPAERVLYAQASIVAVALCALVLAALFAERREHAAKLTESETRLQSALKAGGVTAFDWQVHTGVTRRSDNAAEVLGHSQQEVLAPDSFVERIHPDDRRFFKACIHSARPANPSYAIAFRYLRPDGQEVWLEETGRVEFDSAGRLVRVRGLTRDITERKRVEAELSTARKQAELANRAKSGFLSAASHDLRQPLQNLALLQSTLRRRIRDAKGHTLITRIGHSVEIMKGILDSLLDVNRIESGRLVPSMSDFQLNVVFDSVADDFRDLAKEKGLEWRMVRSSVNVRSDRHMLEVMIRNLLSNAVRYTEQGTILVGCRRARDKVRIEVWDSGIGIAREDVPRIFQEYYQAQSHLHPEGYGLGLAIVQRLGKTLNHPVSVRSTPGKGSCFSIELSLSRAKVDEADRRKLPIANAHAILGGTVLVIEDDTYVRLGLEQLLESAGLDVVSAVNGNAALALVTKKDIRPDLVLSDFNLPGPMDGIESISALRATVASEIPAIVLTGDVRLQSLGTIKDQNIEIAMKPVDGDQLIQLINQLMPIANSEHGRLEKSLLQ